MVAATRTFGRRQTPPGGGSVGPGAPRGSTPARPTAPTLGPEAQAFRAQLNANRARDADDFSAWRRSYRARRLLVLFGGAALMVLPALARVALQAPWWMCLTCEAAALFANAWLRRERRRQIKAIASWDGDRSRP